jgi:hypothetical protein
MSDEKTGYADLLDAIVRPLVDNPDDLVVTECATEGGSAVEFKVNAADGGRVVGRGGETIRAIRLLVEFAGSMHGERAVADLEDA